jgi:hypothetical protein
MNITTAQYGETLKISARVIEDHPHLGSVSLHLGPNRLFLCMEEAEQIVLALAGAIAAAKAREGGAA